MSIQAEVKTKLIKEYANAENDTGSVEVQCAILSERIKIQYYSITQVEHSSAHNLLPYFKEKFYETP